MTFNRFKNEKTPVKIKELNIILSDVELFITEDEYRELVFGVSSDKFLLMILKSNEKTLKMIDSDMIAKIKPDCVEFSGLYFESVKQ